MPNIRARLAAVVEFTSSKGNLCFKLTFECLEASATPTIIAYLPSNATFLPIWRDVINIVSPDAYREGLSIELSCNSIADAFHQLEVELYVEDEMFRGLVRPSVKGIQVIGKSLVMSSDEAYLRYVFGDLSWEETNVIYNTERIRPMAGTVYNVRVQSPFILTQRQVKDSLGVGFKVLSVETDRDLPNIEIRDVDSAVEAIVKVGYRSLVRANHPDLGGFTEVTMILNRAKKELLELLESVKS